MSRDFWSVLAATLCATGAFAYTHYPVPDAAVRESPDAEAFAAPLTARPGNKLATFAGGCFWGVEERLRVLPGVIATRAGYTGGSSDSPRPSYRTVHADKRGFVEAVELVYDPKRVRYETLLANFLTGHKSEKHSVKVKNDIAAPYRWFVFAHDAAQMAAAKKYLATGNIGRTAIRPAQKFWTAEEHHQQYYANRTSLGGATCGM